MVSKSSCKHTRSEPGGLTEGPWLAQRQKGKKSESGHPQLSPEALTHDFLSHPSKADNVLHCHLAVITYSALKKKKGVQNFIFFDSYIFSKLHMFLLVHHND